MRIVELELKRTSICSCGFPTLKEEIKVGTKYKVDLDSIEEGAVFICGGCRNTLWSLKTILTEQITKPDTPMARMPYILFEDDIKAKAGVSRRTA